MVELSNERIEQILHEETKKTEALPTILRGIYSRYMNLYEQYFADIDALNDDQIAEFQIVDGDVLLVKVETNFTVIGLICFHGSRTVLSRLRVFTHFCV